MSAPASSPREPKTAPPSVRPEILFPLFAEVSVLPGIGPRFAKML